MKHIKLFEEFVQNIHEKDNSTLDDVEDDGASVSVEIDLEDEEENDLDIEDDESLEERARPPRITKKQRAANSVKSAVSKKMLGPEGPLRPIINKIFLKIEKEIKKEASKNGIPIANINIDKLTLRR